MAMAMANGVDPSKLLLLDAGIQGLLGMEARRQRQAMRRRGRRDWMGILVG